ncbi:Aspartate ammonia-lyase [Trypanosoma rangeli]|uniref:Aspartate ammonia-lyase n=1 Tax=Trypanosoma rangeli TaxID=5698 RepID=A0A422P4V3_TRYRA|nr:Aspartate ammonia-lyase [Trypanosoma rangeli]RNF12750.1 Aspartate ammonia-lyase [Trypanosoma rangeli]|eukprot:RNF12750.1 Aspartate ammonia-lyase [Trypanosoma rangeli]
MATTALEPQQDLPRIEIFPTLKAVTVFRDRAQLTYVANAALTVGTHILSLKGEKGWGGVLENTLQIRLEDAANQPVVMRGVRVKTHVNKEDIRERVRELEKARDENLERLNVISDKNAVNDAIEIALKDMENKLNTMGKRDKGQYAHVNVDHMAQFLSKPASWKGLTRFIARRKLQLGQCRLTLLEEENELVLKEHKIEKDLNDLKYDLCNERREMSVELIISVHERAVNLKLFVSFVIMGASWTPLYDIRMNRGQSVVDVTYHAQVCQKTSMDWNKVQMKLSTATPHFSSAPPELLDWKISLQPSVRPGRSSCGLMALRLLDEPGLTRANVDSPVPQSARVEQAEVSSLSSSSTFQIVGLATVRSDNRPVKLTIAVCTFPVKRMYHAVPKRTPWTYLIIKANNTSPYLFLAGKANVFANNIFVGKSEFGFVPAGAEFTTSLGTDDAVSVTRKRVKRMESTVRAMLRNPQVIIEYVYEFTVKGSLTTEAALVVKDQCPISLHNDIRVKLRDPSRKMLADGMTAEGNECSVDSEGVVEWQLQLPSGAFTRVFRFAFQVEYNEEMNVVGLEEGQ